MKSGATARRRSSSAAGSGSSSVSMPSARASAATLANQMRSCGSSPWVMTSGTLPPRRAVRRGSVRLRRGSRRRPRLPRRGARFALEHCLHQIAQPRAYLLVDAADVLADEPEAEEHQAREEELQYVAVPEGTERVEWCAGDDAAGHDDDVQEHP